MVLLNDIRRLQEEGKTESEIITALRQQGVSPREIIDALSQTKIKEAVGEAQETPNPYGTPSRQDAQQEALIPSRGADTIPQTQMQELQNPQMAQEFSPSQPIQMEQSAQYQAQQPQQAAYQEYQQYPAQGGISPDTITEISEQVVSEKLAPLRKDIEEVLDLKTTMEAKVEYLDERLKKIEKIIDRLNLSIMQKVGDYMTNIDDIKKEIIETQKSFKALAPSLNTSMSKEKPKKALLQTKNQFESEPESE
ncbi:MAG TPA: hypothetical protein VI544_00990 [Candidatus Nanoarchaeia archaeon]|nr:hypothetical protein [Candidatus Nanoarchaeia archaeon]